MASNGVIGRGNALPWRLRSDLKRFKQMTMGHCLVMGRKTYQSIGRPLPGRQTIVLTRTGFEPDDAHVAVASSVERIERLVEPQRQVMVVGGAEVYRAALPHCDTLWLTRVLADIDGDTHFPQVDWDTWELLTSEHHDAGQYDDWPTEFQIWKRLKK
jgi:dihydrofolate reductase